MTHPEIQLDAIQLVGIEVRTNNQSSTDIAELWQTFFANSVQDRIPNCIDSRFFGLYSHYESDHNGDYSFMIGCPVSDLNSVPQGMVGREIPAQKYQVVRAKGAMPDAIIEAWQTVWSSTMPRTFGYDFEIYDDRAMNPENVEVDIFIAVK